MSVEISVDEEVFSLLKSKAEPFVDTPNSVLRRLLGLERAVASAPPAVQESVSTDKWSASRKQRHRSSPKGRTRTRAPSGTLLPEERYEVPLLRALVAAGGQGPSKEVIEAVGRDLKDDLTELDLETLSSGGVRWQNRIQFVRLRLIERGLMDRNTPRGIWGISEKGREHLDGLSRQDQ